MIITSVVSNPGIPSDRSEGAVAERLCRLVAAEYWLVATVAAKKRALQSTMKPQGSAPARCHWCVALCALWMLLDGNCPCVCECVCVPGSPAAPWDPPPLFAQTHGSLRSGQSHGENKAMSPRGMTNIVCLLYVGWVTNYVSNNSGAAKVRVSRGDQGGRKLEEDSKGETLKIIERLERLESVVNEHIKG
uniref:Uncharacterized protein n=1 Tax=Knipowitschia caucasica TaxID=637954 RepID=A0AAV2KYS0_KNICA